MKRILLILFLSASVACGQTYNVKVDANGNVLHSQLQNTATNPTGEVDYETGKLKVNGVAVTTGGGGSAPPFADTTAIIKGSVDPLKLLRIEVDRIEYTGPAAVVDLGGNFYTETAFTAGGNFSTNGNFVTIGDFFSGGVVELSNDFRTDGAFPITLRAPAEVNINLPLTGTVATQEYGAATWQPKDDDLTSLAAIEAEESMVYRQSNSNWFPVDIGNGLVFASGKLDVLRDFMVPRSSTVSAATLDLTGLARAEIDVLNSNAITSITGLADGEEVLLRFVDGLTLEQGASLKLLGGIDTIAPVNSWGRFRRDGAVVTAIDFQDEDGYSKQTLGDTFMDFGATIGFFPGGGGTYFDIGNKTNAGNFFRFTSGDAIQLLKFDASGGVSFNTDLLTATRSVTYQDRDITFAGIAGETFTDATINGLDVSGALDLTGVITPPALTADVNDYAPAGFATTSTLRVATDGLGDRTITGLAGGTAGKLVILYNDDVGSNINLTAFDASSADANQLTGQYSLQPFQSTLLRYDATLLKWVTVAQPPQQAEFTPWGFIAGNILDQTDLQTALNARLSLTGGTLTGQLIAAAGSTASNSAGIKLQSGALQTTAQAGAFEFLTDAFYLTKTTGPTRASIVLGPSAGPITFAGPTAARIITVPNAASTMARTDAAQTFTGVQTMTSPAITTPAITGLATGSGVSATATASTLVARDANGDSTTGNIISSVAGKGLQLQSGTGARAGNATLVGGTVTVTNTTVNSTNDILLMTRKTSGGTIGMALTYTLSNATSFTMNSDNILDTSTISYMLVKVN